MNISTHCNWSLDGLYIGLLKQKSLNFFAKFFNRVFGQNVASQNSLNALINIHRQIYLSYNYNKSQPAFLLSPTPTNPSPQNQPKQETSFYQADFISNIYHTINKMQKSTHIKNRSKKRIQSTCLSIQHPLAFSIELKPNSYSHNISPTSASQNLKIPRNISTQEKKKRVVSAQVNNSSVRILPGKSYTNWSLNNSTEKTQHTQDIKWIGVFPNHKNSQISYNQAFPKRQQKNADQSLANFMLRYGRFFKNQRQSQSLLKSAPMKGDCNLIMNAATVKVKPRLTWFGKRKNSLTQKGYYGEDKAEVGVVWWKSKK